MVSLSPCPSSDGSSRKSIPQGQQSSSAGGPSADLLVVYLEKHNRSWILGKKCSRWTLTLG